MALILLSGPEYFSSVVTPENTRQLSALERVEVGKEDERESVRKDERKQVRIGRSKRREDEKG